MPDHANKSLAYAFKNDDRSFEALLRSVMLRANVSICTAQLIGKCSLSVAFNLAQALLKFVMTMLLFLCSTRLIE